MEKEVYYKMLASEVTNDILANLRIKNFTNNSALIGAFAEETTKELIKKIVTPLRVSTGTVIRKTSMESQDLLQLDCIIWNPTPFPALFEKGNFGMIPYQGSLAVVVY